MKTSNDNWLNAFDLWHDFAHRYPQLGYRDNCWGLYNFLRVHRNSLLKAGVIRKARNKFWLADRNRFNDAAFALATGQSLEVPGSETVEHLIDPFGTVESRASGLRS
jgi:hypothetical protein